MRYVDLRRLSRRDTHVREQLRTGRLVRLTPEIAVPVAELHNQKPWERATTRATAFAKAADRATLCSLSAARAHGLSVSSSSPVVELSYVNHLQAPPRKTWPENVRYRRSLVLPEEVADLGGYRATTIPRTVLDVARYHGVEEGVVVMDSAIRDHGLRLEELAQHLDNLGRARGITQSRRAIELATGLAESPLESLARVKLLQWDNPLVRTVQEQVEVVLPDGTRVRLDLLVNGWLVGELDGEFKYDGETFGKPADTVLRQERLRENAIQRQGYIVVRFGWLDLQSNGSGPCNFLKTVGELLDRYGPDGPGVVA